MKLKYIILALCILAFTNTAFSQQYWKVSGYSEATAKSYLNSNSSNLDPIEGIWQTTEGAKYAIEKDVENGVRQKDQYRMIVLDHFMRWWQTGEIQAFITPGSSESLYSMKYYTKYANNGAAAGTRNYFLYQESYNLASFTRVTNDYGDKEKVTWYKLYPKQRESSNSNGTHTAGTKWSGTGFFLSKNGYIITNQHVIDGAKSIKVTSISGNRNSTYNARVEVSDKQNDLAIIKITDYFTQPTTIPYSFKFSTSSIGENCWVLGYPLTQTMGEDIKLTNGIISSKSGFDGNIAQYQISAPVQPGNSGGPVFDSNGNLIGVVQAKHGAAENAGYAVKASYVRNLIDMLPASITLPQTNQLAGKSLPQQVELASKCVVLIICE